MRKIYLLFLMLLSIGAMAQVPSNDACSNALAVALPASGSVCFNSSNTNATSNGSITCDTAGPGKEVWYTFIATNSNNSVTVTPNGASPISNVVVTLMTGGCGSGTYDMCNSGTGSNPVTSTVGLVPGTQVWVSVESNGGGTGDFQVCINSTPPSSSPGDGCASASNVCDKSTISYPDLSGFTASGVQPACFAAAVRKDVWIKFTVGVTGTLEFLGTPIAADEYDWALYDVTSGCLGTLVSCNYNYASAGPFSCGIPGSTFGMLTTTTGQPCAAEFNAPVTVTAGRTYALLIDNYSQTNSGFTLDWGGTFQMGTTASFTATPQSSCSVPLVVNITNNSVGAATYQWNFGDGSTSTSPNPGTHTYTSTGDYLISLVVTGNGCTSVMSKRINLNTGPVIAMTPASQTICPGDSVNLNGVLSLGTPYNDRLFTSNVNTAIPNNSAAGLTNALTSSGMLNTTLTTGSVQSICFTINHTDHSDIGRGPTPTAVQVTVNGNTYNFTPLPLPAVSGTATYCFPQAVLNAINAAGGNANTTWTLKVADNRGGGGGTGSLVSWEVVLRDFNSITGYSWSPTTNMVNSTTLTPTVTPVSSTTYVLSATDLFGCSTSFSVPITVNAGITPTFTAVAPICSGGTLSALPTTSNNGVTGTWSPALNNTATTVYTFTPTAGQCASTVTMTITVNPNVTPTFTAVAPICSGAALSALPTTSNNGITGTWSPALNNTATTVYTFTPTAGQCATTTTMTITVNPNVTPTFTAVAPICSGAALSALPTTSNNGITGTWSPALNNTATTVYTFTPTAGQCATTTTMTITVNPNVTPTFTAVAPICSGAALSALPTTSNNGITGTWSPALNNTATTVYTFTPTAGQCATTTTMSITVNPNVTPTFTAVAPICSGAALSALPTTSNNGITGTWSPALNNTATTVYTFTPTAGQCATTTTMTITVNPNVTPTFTAVAPICSGAALSALPTTSNNGITGTWSPALNNTATTVYTFTPTAGQCATTTTMTITVNPNVTPTFTAVAPICSGAALSALPTTSNNGITGTWSPALNNTATTVYTFTPTAGQCATTTTMTITVNPNVTPTFTAVAPICSGAALSALPTTSNNGITGTWSPALNNTATTVYTFTPTAGQCATTTTMTITVNPNVTPTFTAVAPICSGAALSALPTTSNNGITGTWSPALNNTATTVYAFTPTAGQCATTITMTITVNPLPANPTASVTFQPTCVISTGTIVVTAPTGATLEYSVNGVSYQSSTTFAGLAPGTYNVTVHNTATNCFSGATVLIVNPAPGAPATPTASVTVQPTCTTPTGTIVVTAPTGATLEYSINGVTFQSGTTFTGVAPGTYTVMVRDTGSGCSSATSVTVNPIPANPTAPTASVTVQPTCTTPTGTIVITAPTGATLEYSVNGVTYQAGTSFAGLASGVYNVTVRDTATGCVSSATSVTVNPIPVNPAAPTASVTVQPTCTTPTGTIVVTAPTGATLEYSINGVTYQAGTSFAGLASGSYNVTVRDTATGCVSSATSVTVNPIPANPAAPTASVTVQPTCTTPTGTIVITAPTGATLEYSINGVTYQVGTSFAGLASGAYNVTVRDTATGCVSSNTSVTVNPIPANPAAPTASVTAQPTCTTPTGTIVITTPTGATLEYSINGVTYQAGTSFAGLASGSYNVTVRDTATGCVSAATSVTVNPIPANPTAPISTVVSPSTCAITTGSITITAPTGATLEYSVNGVTYQAGTLFSGLASGTYNVTVRDTATGCVSSAATETINPAPGAPTTPTASVTVQPTCTTPTGTIVITAPTGATLEYSINGVTYQAGTSFAGLASGTYNVTVRDTATGCVSAATSVTVNPIPANPTAPTASTTVQPTCTTPTGTIVVTAPTGATLEYSIDGVTYQAATSFSGLASGTYNVTVRDTTTGCVSSSTSVTVNPIPANPTAPISTVVSPSTCAMTTGSITVTAPIGATLEYSIDGVTYQSGTLFTGLASGTYNVTVRDTATGCISSAATETINPAPGAPGAPTASATVQPTCAIPTGTIVVTAPIGATLEYSIDGITYQSGTSFAGIAPGTYSVTVRDTVTGCVSSAASVTVNPIPTAPTVPVASVTLQPTCTVPTGTIDVTSPLGATLEYSIDGVVYQTSTSFVGLAPGNYTVSVRDIITGCVSSNVAILVVDIVPVPVSVSITGGCTDGNYTLTATPMDNTAYSYEWFDSSGTSIGSVNPITVAVAGIYTVEVTASGSGCVSQDIITVVSAFCDIPRGISPNGDGKNDAFDITGLNAKSVKIFNRYGVATYTYGSGYTNQWHGQSNSGQELPDGTYYYVIDTAEGQTRTGWVYINRER